MAARTSFPFPSFADPQAYALEISGDSIVPVFRDGDTVIVSPAASIRHGDRVVVKTSYGEVMAKILLRQSTKRIELISINQAHEDHSLGLKTLAGCRASLG